MKDKKILFFVVLMLLCTLLLSTMLFACDKKPDGLDSKEGLSLMFENNKTEVDNLANEGNFNYFVVDSKNNLDKLPLVLSDLDENKKAVVVSNMALLMQKYNLQYVITQDKTSNKYNIDFSSIYASKGTPLDALAEFMLTVGNPEYKGETETLTEMKNLISKETIVIGKYAFTNKPSKFNAKEVVKILGLYEPSADSNFIYIKGTKILIDYVGTATDITIPADVSEIFFDAFKGKTTLQKITINKNVKIVHGNLFNGLNVEVVINIDKKPDGWSDNWNGGTEITKPEWEIDTETEVEETISDDVDSFTNILSKETAKARVTAFNTKYNITNLYEIGKNKNRAILDQYIAQKPTTAQEKIKENVNKIFETYDVEFLIAKQGNKLIILSFVYAKENSLKASYEIYFGLDRTTANGVYDSSLIDNALAHEHAGFMKEGKYAYAEELGANEIEVLNKDFYTLLDKVDVVEEFVYLKNTKTLLGYNGKDKDIVIPSKAETIYTLAFVNNQVDSITINDNVKTILYNAIGANSSKMIVKVNMLSPLQNWDKGAFNNIEVQYKAKDLEWFINNDESFKEIIKTYGQTKYQTQNYFVVSKNTIDKNLNKIQKYVSVIRDRLESNTEVLPLDKCVDNFIKYVKKYDVQFVIYDEIQAMDNQQVFYAEQIELSMSIIIGGVYCLPSIDESKIENYVPDFMYTKAYGFAFLCGGEDPLSQKDFIALLNVIGEVSYDDNKFGFIKDTKILVDYKGASTETITIPAGTERINGRLFEDLNKTTKYIYIPSSVKSINQQAFSTAKLEYHFQSANISKEILYVVFNNKHNVVIANYDDENNREVIKNPNEPDPPTRFDDLAYYVEKNGSKFPLTHDPYVLTKDTPNGIGILKNMFELVGEDEKFAVQLQQAFNKYDIQILLDYDKDTDNLDIIPYVIYVGQGDYLEGLTAFSNPINRIDINIDNIEINEEAIRMADKRGMVYDNRFIIMCEYLSSNNVYQVIDALGIGEQKGNFTYMKGTNDLIYFNDYAKEIVIPQGTERIIGLAFEYYKGADTIVVPDSVTYIGDRALSDLSTNTVIKFNHKNLVPEFRKVFETARFNRTLIWNATATENDQIKDVVQCNNISFPDRQKSMNDLYSMYVGNKEFVSYLQKSNPFKNGTIEIVSKYTISDSPSHYPGEIYGKLNEFISGFADKAVTGSPEVYKQRLIKLINNFDLQFLFYKSQDGKQTEPVMHVMYASNSLNVYYQFVSIMNESFNFDETASSIPNINAYEEIRISHTIAKDFMVYGMMESKLFTFFDDVFGVEIKDGFKYIKGSNIVIGYVGADINTIVVPEGVTEIKLDTFNNLHNCYTIVIPDSVEYIGFNAIPKYAVTFKFTRDKLSNALNRALINDAGFNNRVILNSGTDHEEIIEKVPSGPIIKANSFTSLLSDNEATNRINDIKTTYALEELYLISKGKNVDILNQYINTKTVDNYEQLKKNVDYLFVTYGLEFFIAKKGGQLIVINFVFATNDPIRAMLEFQQGLVNPLPNGVINQETIENELNNGNEGFIAYNNYAYRSSNKNNEIELSIIDFYTLLNKVEIENNFVYIKESNVLLGYNGVEQDIIIPERVEEIHSLAFNGDAVASITINRTVKYVRPNAIGEDSLNLKVFLEDEIIPEAWDKASINKQAIVIFDYTNYNGLYKYIGNKQFERFFNTDKGEAIIISRGNEFAYKAYMDYLLNGVPADVKTEATEVYYARYKEMLDMFDHEMIGYMQNGKIVEVNTDIAYSKNMILSMAAVNYIFNPNYTIKDILVSDPYMEYNYYYMAMEINNISVNANVFRNGNQEEFINKVTTDFIGAITPVVYDNNGFGFINGTELVSYKGDPAVSSIKIPDYTTKITGNVFYEYKMIRDMYFPVSIKEIYSKALCSECTEYRFADMEISETLKKVLFGSGNNVTIILNFDDPNNRIVINKDDNNGPDIEPTPGGSFSSLLPDPESRDRILAFCEKYNLINFYIINKDSLDKEGPNADILQQYIEQKPVAAQEQIKNNAERILKSYNAEFFIVPIFSETSPKLVILSFVYSPTNPLRAMWEIYFGLDRTSENGVVEQSQIEEAMKHQHAGFVRVGNYAYFEEIGGNEVEVLNKDFYELLNLVEIENGFVYLRGTNMLLGYNGNEKDIVIPDRAEVINTLAFVNDQVNSITINENVLEIKYNAIGANSPNMKIYANVNSPLPGWDDFAFNNKEVICQGGGDSGGSEVAPVGGFVELNKNRDINLEVGCSNPNTQLGVANIDNMEVFDAILDNNYGSDMENLKAIKDNIHQLFKQYAIEVVYPYNKEDANKSCTFIELYLFYIGNPNGETIERVVAKVANAFRGAIAADQEEDDQNIKDYLMAMDKQYIIAGNYFIGNYSETILNDMINYIGMVDTRQDGLYVLDSNILAHANVKGSVYTINNSVTDVAGDAFAGTSVEKIYINSPVKLHYGVLNQIRGISALTIYSKLPKNQVEWHSSWSYGLETSTRLTVIWDYQGSKTEEVIQEGSGLPVQEKDLVNLYTNNESFKQSIFTPFEIDYTQYDLRLMHKGSDRKLFDLFINSYKLTLPIPKEDAIDKMIELFTAFDLQFILIVEDEANNVAYPFNYVVYSTDIAASHHGVMSILQDSTYTNPTEMVVPYNIKADYNPALTNIGNFLIKSEGFDRYALNIVNYFTKVENRNGYYIVDNSLIYIEDKGLNYITIPEGVRSIEGSAFDGINTKIDYVSIPESVISIDNYMFSGDLNDAEIRLAHSIPNYELSKAIRSGKSTCKIIWDYNNLRVKEDGTLNDFYATGMVRNIVNDINAFALNDLYQGPAGFAHYIDRFDGRDNIMHLVSIMQDKLDSNRKNQLANDIAKLVYETGLQLMYLYIGDSYAEVSESIIYADIDVLDAYVRFKGYLEFATDIRGNAQYDSFVDDIMKNGSVEGNYIILNSTTYMSSKNKYALKEDCVQGATADYYTNKNGDILLAATGEGVFVVPDNIKTIEIGAFNGSNYTEIIVNQNVTLIRNNAFIGTKDYLVVKVELQESQVNFEAGWNTNVNVVFDYKNVQPKDLYYYYNNSPEFKAHFDSYNMTYHGDLLENKKTVLVSKHNLENAWTIVDHFFPVEMDPPAAEGQEAVQNAENKKLRDILYNNYKKIITAYDAQIFYFVNSVDNKVYDASLYFVYSKDIPRLMAALGDYENLINPNMDINNVVPLENQDNGYMYFNNFAINTYLGANPEYDQNEMLQFAKELGIEHEVVGDFIKYQTTIMGYVGDRNVEHVTIPEGITAVEMELFSNMPNLKSIYVPASVKHIDMDAMQTYVKDELKGGSKRPIDVQWQMASQPIRSIRENFQNRAIDNVIWDYNGSKILDSIRIHESQVNHFGLKACFTIEKTLNTMLDGVGFKGTNPDYVDRYGDSHLIEQLIWGYKTEMQFTTSQDNDRVNKIMKLLDETGLQLIIYTLEEGYNSNSIISESIMYAETNVLDAYVRLQCILNYNKDSSEQSDEYQTIMRETLTRAVVNNNFLYFFDEREMLNESKFTFTNNIKNENGFVTSLDGRVLIKAPNGEGEYTIPSNIVAIMPGALKNTNYTSIVIPTTVEQIGSDAFNGANASLTIKTNYEFRPDTWAKDFNGAFNVEFSSIVKKAQM